MPILAWLARAFLLRRLFGGGGRGRGRGYGYSRGGYGRGGYGYGRRQGRGGVFPFPHYSTRTRGGSRVSVGGCCLPIPLTLFLAAIAGLRALVRR
jgi:hypothetical protein